MSSAARDTQRAWTVGGALVLLVVVLESGGGGFWPDGGLVRTLLLAGRAPVSEVATEGD
ncbi:MAG: hypothetical protein RJQ01_01075 [Microcella sp.]|uniref:hypothetical protein n=1 Tax=Microcella sp. TaxID=1913979 RepID=UPI003315191F